MRGDVRGTVVGLVVAAGATWAHQWAGGGAATADPTLLLLLLASLAGGHAVTRRGRTGLPALLVVAGLAQAAWHAALPDPAHAGHVGHSPAGAAGTPMLLAHLLVVLVTVAVAAGADRALVALARDALALPPLPAGVPPAPPSVVTTTPVVVPAAREVAPHGARGPPPDVVRAHVRHR